MKIYQELTQMEENVREEIRKLITETLLIADPRVVGKVIVSDQPSPRGIWIELNNIPHFLGSTTDAARITAQNGDCWNEERDERLKASDIEWFNKRGHLGPLWTREESPLQEQNRRLRIHANLEWTESWINPTFPDPNEYDYYSEPKREIPKNVSDTTMVLPSLIEFVRVDGWSGRWILDEDIEYFQSVVSFRVEEDCYVLQLSKEKRAVEENLILTKVMELDRAEDESIIELRFYDGDERNPNMVLRNDGAGRMVVEKIEQK